MMTTREMLIGWAHFRHGFESGRERSITSNSFEMLDCVEEETRTPADCIRFYLRFVMGPGWDGIAMREKWHKLRRLAMRVDPDSHRPENSELNKMINDFVGDDWDTLVWAKAVPEISHRHKTGRSGWFVKVNQPCIRKLPLP
jgi:hypothetical protein